MKLCAMKLSHFSELEAEVKKPAPGHTASNYWSQDA